MKSFLILSLAILSGLSIHSDAFAGNQVDRILQHHVGSHDGYNNRTGKDCGIVVTSPSSTEDGYGVNLYSSFGEFKLSSDDFKIMKKDGLTQLFYKSTSRVTQTGLIRFNKLGSMIELVVSRSNQTIYCEL